MGVAWKDWGQKSVGLPVGRSRSAASERYIVYFAIGTLLEGYHLSSGKTSTITKRSVSLFNVNTPLKSTWRYATYM